MVTSITKTAFLERSCVVITKKDVITENNLVGGHNLEHEMKHGLHIHIIIHVYLHHKRLLPKSENTQLM